MNGEFGSASFAGLRLLTAPGRVMTPRPATERLVARALELVGADSARIADVGSGSGAIAVAIALHAPQAEIWAVDVSGAAVEVARTNVARHGLGERVHVVHGHLLEPVPGTLDLVVANLPYLPERLRMEPAYADLLAEPAAAVFAPGDGLGHYRRLLAASEKRLRDVGALVIQYRGSVFETRRSEVRRLLGKLEERALAA